MALGGSGQSRFGGIGESLLEARFDPREKDLFAEKLADADAHAVPKSYPIPVRFEAKLDPKAEQAIRKVTLACFEQASAVGLDLKHLHPTVEFYGPREWEKKTGESALELELPAAKLDQSGRFPVIQLILPERIQTTEVVVKTVRLMLSKLFGHLFFGEAVAARAPFSLIQDDLEEISFDFKEKAIFLRFLEIAPAPLVAAFDQEALKQQIRGPKAREIGRKELFKALLKDPASRPQVAQLVQAQFEQLIRELKADPTTTFLRLSGQMDAALPKGGLILPHEKRHFDFFKQSHQWNLFHALEDRLQLVLGYLGELKECYDWTQKLIDHPNELDPDLLRAWRKSLKERNHQLKKRGLVKLYLIDGAHLNRRQRGDLVRFPLWLWQRGLLDHLPTGTSPEKMVARLKEQYRHSLYAKLYEAGFRLLQGLDKVEQTGSTLHLREQPRLKALRSSLGLIEEIIEDLLNTARIASRLAGVARQKPQNKKLILKNYSEGWAYFISFALVHRFYLTNSKEGERAAQFLGLISDYTKSRLDQEASYRIAALLLEVYRKKHFDLRPVIELLTKDHKMLDFFATNQSELFSKKKEEPKDFIETYSGLVDQWQNDRFDNSIQPNELGGFSVKG
ncbi:MAG: hypothetical protein RRB13_01365 [bacterium]|nr:hypothetical protein [bacterium]